MMMKEEKERRVELLVRASLWVQNIHTNKKGSFWKRRRRKLCNDVAEGPAAISIMKPTSGTFGGKF